MLTLHHDQLRFAFPAVHPQAGCTIAFQRTLRVPDDGAAPRTGQVPAPAGR